MTSTSLLSNKIYNVIKWITALFIPALITLYLSLADVWNFPNPEKVVLTAAAVNVSSCLVTFTDSALQGTPRRKMVHI